MCGGVKVNETGCCDLHLVAIGVFPKSSSLILGESVGLKLGEQGRVPVSFASDGHGKSSP